MDLWRVLLFGVITFVVVQFQNCSSGSFSSTFHALSEIRNSTINVTSPQVLGRLGFGPLGAKYSNGKLYVFDSNSLYTSTDGLNWSIEPSNFKETSLQLTVELTDGRMVHYNSADPKFDGSRWKANWAAYDSPNGNDAGSGEYFIDALPGDSDETYQMIDAFRTGERIYISLLRLITQTQPWRGTLHVEGLVAESHLVRSKLGSITEFEYVGRIGGVDDYKFLILDSGSSFDPIPLYYSAGARCHGFSDVELICAMRASADDDDHSRKLDPREIFSQILSSPPMGTPFIYGSKAYPLIYSPPLDASLYYVGTRPVPPLMVAVSSDGGLSWHRRLISSQGGIDSDFAYDPVSGRVVIAYGGLTYPRRGVAIQSSMDKGQTWSNPTIITDDADAFTSGTVFIENVGSNRFVVVYDVLPHYFQFDPSRKLIRDGIELRSRLLNF